MDITFEILKEKDLKETWQLCMKSFGEDFTFEEIQKTYNLCRNDEHYYFIVGKSDGKIIAYTTMIIFYNLFDGLNPIATLWYVCVDDNYRRHGVGKKMFEYIEQIAKEKNCEIIYFTCLQDNYGAHRFYRSVGYTDDKEKAFVKYFFEDKK